MVIDIIFHYIPATIDIAKSPKTIYRVSQNDLEGMKKTRSFFYRKFSKSSDIEQYIYDFIL